MDIQVIDNNVAIIDNGAVVKVFPLSLNTSIMNHERYTYTLYVGDGETEIHPQAMKMIKGAFIVADGVVKLTDANGQSWIGQSFYIDSIDAKKMTIEPLYIEKDRGLVSSVSHNEDTDIVTVNAKDKNYTHTRLIGTPIYGCRPSEPADSWAFFVSGQYIIKITDYTAIMFELDNVACYPTEEEAVQNLISHVESTINGYACREIITCHYEDHRLILKHTESGHKHIEFVRDPAASQVKLGMDYQKLLYGTEDYTGMKVKFPSSELEASNIITDIDGVVIKYVDATSPIVLPEKNDHFIIYDDAAGNDIQVKVLTYV